MAGLPVEPGQAMSQYQVFVSFTEDDRAIADAVESALESAGMNCWAYKSDQRAGSYAENIEAAIQQCRVFVVVLTSNANASTGIKKEVALAAMANEVQIVPFRPDPTVKPGAGLGYHLAGLHMPESIPELVKLAADILDPRADTNTDTNRPHPPAPSRPPLPPPVAVGLTGTWQQFPTGVVHAIMQVGNIVTIEARDPSGTVVVMHGQGTLTGNELHIAYQATYQLPFQPPFVAAGQIHCLVSPDGRQISGQAVDQFRGGYLMQLNRLG